MLSTRALGACSLMVNKRYGYPGGKGTFGVYQTIINCLPPHEVYVEAFLGAGAVLRHKRLASLSIGIDIDSAVIEGWATRTSSSFQIIHADALQLLAQWNWSDQDRRQTLVYCDPPYLGDVRRSARSTYKHDFAAAEQHADLLGILVALPCMVVLSGYRSTLYESFLGKWRQLDFSTVNRAGQKAVETLWMNYPAPTALHDYRYLGTNFRERERIKRKRMRWRARLASMTQLERRAIFWAIQEDKLITDSNVDDTKAGTGCHRP